jgi:arylsulfatase A-like enzyme
MTVDAMTSHVDFKATMLDLLGVSADGGDGISLGPLLRGETGIGRETIWAEYHPRTVAEQYNHTLIAADWRLTLYPRRADWGELFDRWADPDETRNLFHEREHQAVRDRLIARLRRDWPAAPEAGGPRIAIY